MRTAWKQTGAIALIVTLILHLTALWGGPTAYAETEDGSADHPYLVANAEQLAAIGTGEYGLNDHYLLTADIDLAGYTNASGYETWTPIGTDSAPFTGTFDGGGHTIFNLKVYDQKGANVYFANRVGLFGSVNGATISNIGLTDAYVSGTEYVGGLVGYMQNSTVNNAYVTGTISGSETGTPSSDLGGLVGYALGIGGASTISYSYTAVAIINGGSNMGELLGLAQGNFSEPGSNYYADVGTISSSYGTSLSTSGMKQQASFAGWDFDNTWHIFDGWTYPLLQSDYGRITLAGLSLQDATDGEGETIALSPDYAGSQTDYGARVTASVGTIKLEAAANDAQSTLAVAVNGVTVTENTYSSTEALSPIPLNGGVNTITLTVNNPYGTYSPTYTLTIVREDGSAAYPHSISSPEQLAAIGTGGYGLDGDYVLTQDIDLDGYLSAAGAGYHGGKGWKPIGDAAHKFTGSLDGQGHVIRHLAIHRPDEDDMGLFGYTDGAAMKNIGVTDAHVTGGNNVGGLVGDAAGTSLTNTFATGTVTGASHTGGLAGIEAAGDLVAVSRSYAFVSVTGTTYVGGLIGYAVSGVSDSYARGAVNGQSYVGGLVGFHSIDTHSLGVTNSYAAGKVTGNSNVGGLMGYEAKTPASSYWDTEVTGQGTSALSNASYGKTTDGMKTKATFADDGWDFTSVWGMMNGATYPMHIDDFDAVKLTGIAVTAAGATAAWDQPFSYEQGVYTIILDRYVPSVDTSVTPAAAGATVMIGNPASAVSGTSASIPVSVGNNDIPIVITGQNGIAQGEYVLHVEVPPPAVTDVTVPAAGTYGEHDTLMFNVVYGGHVVVTGTPRLPIIVGNGSVTQTVYADYAGERQVVLTALPFEYVVPAGQLDSDGIGIGAEIALPSGASIAAEGLPVSLTLVPPDPAETGGIHINSYAPSINLTPDNSNPTVEPLIIAVTANVYDAASGNALARLNWMTGSHTAADFAGGTQGENMLTTPSFSVASNGTYTVYAKDTAGNEAVKEIAIANIVTAAPELTLTSSPKTATAGTVTVNVAASVYGAGAGNALFSLNWMAGSHTAADFAGGTQGENMLTASSFPVASNGTYTVYAKDAAGNEAVKEIAIANIVTAAPELTLTSSPTTATAGTVTVNVTASVYGVGAGNALASLNWMAGSRAAADFAGGTQGEDILTTLSFSVASNGTYTVYAKDAAGNEAVKEIAITNISGSSSSDEGSGGKAASPPAFDIIQTADGGIVLHVNSSAIKKETLADGSVTEQVDLSDDLMHRILDALKEAKKPFITIAINDSGIAVQVRFPAASLSEVARLYPDAVFDVQLNGASSQLQVNVPDLSHLAEQFGVGVEDLKVLVKMRQVGEQEQAQLVQAAEKQHLRLLANAVDYTIAVSAGERTIEVKDFGGAYMARAIVLDADLVSQAGQTITAVWYDPDNHSLHFVPAVLDTREDGKREMTMRTPHNSIYAIVASEGVTFSDLSGHWAKNDVELLASKLIISGMSAERFAPDQSVTRAEFTALLIRALGMRTEDTAASSQFADVDARAWYASVVAAAVKAGLVQGIDASHFAPNAEITREQMAVMIAKAMKSAGKPLDIADNRQALNAFVDQASISDWAKAAVTQVTDAGIIHGYSDHSFVPRGLATRAEAAVMLKGYLQYAGFMGAGQ